MRRGYFSGFISVIIGVLSPLPEAAFTARGMRTRLEWGNIYPYSSQEFPGKAVYKPTRPTLSQAKRRRLARRMG